MKKLTALLTALALALSLTACGTKTPGSASSGSQPPANTSASSSDPGADNDDGVWSPVDADGNTKRDERDAVSENGMVASSNVYATMAGVQILEEGGNAVDAAIAVAYALGVAEPYTSKKSQLNEKIEAVTPRTLVVGIDISKEKQWARFVDCRGVECGKAMYFSNDRTGFEAISAKIREISKKNSFADAIVGMEPTGHYWKALANYLMKQDCVHVVLVNPYHTKKAKELDDNSQTKSDKKAALTIARLVKDGRYSEVYLPHNIYAGLRVLTTARNLNRCYPGVEDGALSEQVAYAVANMIRTLDIDMEIDLHESSLEYAVNNATVAHERAMSIASEGYLDLELSGISMSLEPSPATLHGLTHRELGDWTDTCALLMETGNPVQGRLRGYTDEAPCYVIAYDLGLLYVDYSAGNFPMELRVGRHLVGITAYINAFNKQSDKQIVVSGIPTYDEMANGNLGDYLL